MTLKTRQIGPGFAVEVRGLQLGDALDAALIEELRQVWMDNKVVVLHEQQLSDDELLAFTRRMGPLFAHVRSMFHSREHPEIMFVSNLKEDGRPLGSLGEGDLGWHTDQCYTARPCWGTLLYGIEIPAHGDALFRRLEDWIGQPQFIYTHRWRVGDVVLWDNASVAHRRDAFPADQRRFLKRTGFHLPAELSVPY